MSEYEKAFYDFSHMCRKEEKLGCKNCPVYKIVYEKNLSCSIVLQEYPLEVSEATKQWAKNHPVKEEMKLLEQLKEYSKECREIIEKLEGKILYL